LGLSLVCKEEEALVVLVLLDREFPYLDTLNIILVSILVIPALNVGLDLPTLETH
jgi:hypothetical protein